MLSPVDALKASGLQVTAQRIAVLRAVSANPHCTADTVMEKAAAELGSISRQAVYDVLSALTEKHLLRRIQPSGASALYEDRVLDNHHHVVCRQCGAVADVDCAVGDTPCLVAADDQHFSIDEAEVIYWGQCPQCQTSPVVATTSEDRPRRRKTDVNS